jgi:hypothetical protein
MREPPSAQLWRQRLMRTARAIGAVGGGRSKKEAGPLIETVESRCLTQGPAMGTNIES